MFYIIKWYLLVLNGGQERGRRVEEGEGKKGRGRRGGEEEEREEEGGEERKGGREGMEWWKGLEEKNGKESRGGQEGSEGERWGGWGRGEWRNRVEVREERGRENK